jgi:hypothetical protein
MARTKKTARKVVVPYNPAIEQKKIDGQDMPRQFFRINDNLGILMTFNKLYLVDVTSKFKNFKVIRDL